ncbi:virulence factor [Sphingomonas sp. H160509]|uniref:virulence factor n=1 Tax=Sphingomonas sp. H160509 TaxID=2955313 RepID=UPI00209776F6|nr:virulence factor [Sphingomonas sp. H160509]MDD1451666.1 virulence factor [Sphingomonas sp. H160509]
MCILPPASTPRRHHQSRWSISRATWGCDSCSVRRPRGGLTEHGIPVVGITTPALFAHHRTRQELDAIIADGVRTALARTGAKRVVVMGQSYGADIVQTGLANLPTDLRARVAAIVLILPGDTVFYRADPSGLLYDHTTPDSMGATTGNRLTWAPVTCIYGVEETDSLCPLLTTANARKVGMPGGIISITMRRDCWGMCWLRSVRWRRGLAGGSRATDHLRSDPLQRGAPDYSFRRPDESQDSG